MSAAKRADRARRLLVLSDMDGTFVRTDKSVSAANLRALDALAARGGVFAPCTGRPARMLPRELLDHPATRYAVSTNGAVISEVSHDADGRGRLARIARSVSLGPDRARALLDALEGRDVVLDVFTDEGALMSRADYERLGEFIPEPNALALLRRIREVADEPLREAIGHVGSVDRVTVFWRDEGDAALVRELAGADRTLSCVSSMPWNFELTDARATKGSALAWLCEREGIPAADSVAFGDSSNDVSMLLAAGDGVCMANGTNEALAAADHVTGLDNDHDGLAAYLMGLLGE